MLFAISALKSMALPKGIALRTGEMIVVAGTATYVVGTELRGLNNKLLRKK